MFIGITGGEGFTIVVALLLILALFIFNPNFTNIYPLFEEDLTGIDLY